MLELHFERAPEQIAPGAFFIPQWLTPDEQCYWADRFRDWARAPAGLRRGKMPDATPMRVQSVCLGWHWYPYYYSRTCDDHDGEPVKPFPDDVYQLANAAVAATNGRFPAWRPDCAIVNYYDAESRLGLHQDRGEGKRAIAAGSPVVTLSLGDTCIFRFGNTRSRTKPYRDVLLRSGDLFVFGGPARLAYHGVTKILPGTSPADVGLHGRVSITVRESGLNDERA